ncbi:MAG: glutamine-hydrolyzing GMP synthase [Patescibacteria group bacterium]
MEKIAVLDFGGQYAHLITNRVRRLKVYAELVDSMTPASELREYKGIILSGSPFGVHDNGSPTFDDGILELGIPILGICYGHQLMAQKFGGEVKPGEIKEYGLAKLQIKKAEGILKNIPDGQAWMSHGDTVITPGEGFEITGSTGDCECAAVANFDRNFYGIQFHPEVTHTEQGNKILKNFLEICGCSFDWSIESYIDQTVSEIREHAKEKKVFMLVSGGVDSTVCFSLIEKALGTENIYGLFIDTGFMRMDEGNEVEHALRSLGFNNLHTYNASKEYFEALEGVFDPEVKREIIGNLFIEIQRKVTNKLGLNPDEWLFGQGTIYPDTIESAGTKHADKIKTHHNRVEQIRKLIDAGKVIEPLKFLYKDEVREVGEKLGLPHEFVWRHPFPGPGLAVRCLCSEKPDWPADHEKLEHEINEFLNGKAHARILPIKSVGVQGDARTYRHPLALYNYGEIDWNELEKVATDLTNKFGAVNRVLLALKPDNFDFVNAVKGYLSPDRIELLQKADKISMDVIAEHSIEQNIWQFPTVLLPVDVNNHGHESVVLRPICSEEAMTANFYKMDGAILDKLVAKMSELPLSGIFYDITNKPPGTIEWE